MNIITADFNWISLLLIVGAAVFSIIKSASKKDGAKSIFQDADIETEDEYERIFQERENNVEMNERHIMTKKKQTAPLREKAPTQSILKKEEAIEYDSTIEEEEEFQFDIRQAIIGSEILRRPEY